MLLGCVSARTETHDFTPHLLLLYRGGAAILSLFLHLPYEQRPAQRDARRRSRLGQQFQFAQHHPHARRDGSSRGQAGLFLLLRGTRCHAAGPDIRFSLHPEPFFQGLASLPSAQAHLLHQLHHARAGLPPVQQLAQTDGARFRRCRTFPALCPRCDRGSGNGLSPAYRHREPCP